MDIWNVVVDVWNVVVDVWNVVMAVWSARPVQQGKGKRPRWQVHHPHTL